jgi:hypothetical protein
MNQDRRDELGVAARGDRETLSAEIDGPAP